MYDLYISDIIECKSSLIMHKFGSANNQESSGSVVKALSVSCGGPWFDCQ